MKILVMTTAILCAASLSARAASIDGKWISEKQVGDADGKTYPHQSVFILKNDAGSLTSSVVQTSAAPWMRQMTGKLLEISGGKSGRREIFIQIEDRNRQG